MKPWIEIYDIEMYSTNNEEKSVVAQRYIRTLKNKIYKHMTSILKNIAYVDKVDDIINTTILIVEQLKWNLLM